MPLYSFICEEAECGHTLEQHQSLKDFDDPAKLPECPNCGRRMVRTLTAGPGFILKGAGFHKNDYRGVK